MSLLPKFLYPHPIRTGFTMRNLPYGVFRVGQTTHTGVAIGNHILDLTVCEQHSLLRTPTDFFAPGDRLNSFMAGSKKDWVEVRQQVMELLADEGPASLGDGNRGKAGKVLLDRDAVSMVLPAHVGDYTDGYASREHASNLGRMFRPDGEPLMPNWLHIPVAYHGRASSVVVSGTKVRRPRGQQLAVGETEPKFAPSRLMDFEIEIGAFVGGSNELGESFTLQQAEDRIFGLVTMNDWSSRDIQKWEYVPLGPFLGKSFGTTICPWVVPALALEEARVSTPAQSAPAPLPYINQDTNRMTAGNFDIDIECFIKGADQTDYHKVSTTNSKYLYWSIAQQICHHGSNGCNMLPGDLMGTGTISGPEDHQLGSMLELCLAGKRDVKVGEEVRKFLKDGDSVMIRASALDGAIEFGECEGVITPA